MFSPSGGLLANANYRDDTVSVFSVSSSGQLTPVGPATATGAHPFSVAFSPNGGLLATANYSGQTVSLFSVSTGGRLTPVGPAIATGTDPISVAFSPEGGLLANTNSSDDTVSMFAGGEPAARITSPADQQTYTQNQVVATRFFCTTPPGSGPIGSCTDANGAASPSGTLDTTTLGAHAYTVTAASNDTLTANATIRYTVIVAPPPASPTTTTTPTTPTVPPSPTPAQLQITRISATAATIRWCQDVGCPYPATRLRFTLNRAASVRLLLRTRAHGHYKQVATTILHGHQGSNRHLIAGRWHGHLFPIGPVQILVQIPPNHRWTTAKTIHLTVRHPTRQAR